MSEPQDLEPGPKHREPLPILAERQRGVVEVSQVGREDQRRLRAEVRRRRWTRVTDRVVVMHNGPMDTQQRAWVALLAAAGRGVLAGPTALEVEGLRGFETDQVWVTVPCGGKRVDLPWVETKYSRFLDADHVHPLKSPPRTRPGRSLVDAATWVTTDRRARAVLLAGVQQRLVTPAQLRDVLPTRGHCWRHALIAETIEDADGGIASVPELEFDRARVAAGLPRPTRQAVRQRPDGRHYLDVLFEEWNLAVEVDGAQHFAVANWDADLDRQNEIVIDRIALLRYSSFTVRHRVDVLASSLTRAFVSRGWLGV